MAYNRPTLTELHSRILDDIDARVPGADSRLRFSVLGVLARVFAAAFHAAYGLLNHWSRQILPDTADGVHLTRHAANWSVLRKAATKASGTVGVTGTGGAIIPEGAILVRRDGAEYRVTAAAVIAAGVAVVAVAVEAMIEGDAGNTDAAAILSFATPVAGVNAGATVISVGAGNAAENDDSLRARLLRRMQRPPHGGNADDYVDWALAVAGVTRAWNAPNELGLGTVTVRFVMDGRVNIIPQPADVAAVQAYIDDVRPVGSVTTVVAPIAQAVNFLIRAVPPTLAVRQAITEELADLFRRDAAPGGTLLHSRMREAISLAAGEMDHDLNSPGGNASFPAGVIPVLGNVDFI